LCHPVATDSDPPPRKLICRPWKLSSPVLACRRGAPQLCVGKSNVVPASAAGVDVEGPLPVGLAGCGPCARTARLTEVGDPPKYHCEQNRVSTGYVRDSLSDRPRRRGRGWMGGDGAIPDPRPARTGPGGQRSVVVSRKCACRGERLCRLFGVCAW
jgi:hypothetical protein